MTDLFTGAEFAIHEVDVEAAAREALDLLPDRRAHINLREAIGRLPYAASLSADARAAIATRLWVIADEVTA